MRNFTHIVDMIKFKINSTGSKNGGVGNIDLVASERTFNEENIKRRVNWPGIFVGLVTGLARLMSLGTVGAAIGVSSITDLGTLGLGAAG